jgi:glycosyltransferase involved in cell wall biosynthesis
MTIKAKRVLFISNLYPNPLRPTMGAFNRQQISALSEHCAVDVISPVPWTMLRRCRTTESRQEDGVRVYHPTYFYLPRIWRHWYGLFFYWSIWRQATKLLDAGHYDLIYSSWLFPDAWAASRLAEKYGLPLVVKVHGSDVNKLVPGSKVTTKSMHVVDCAKAVICVSAALKDRLVALGASDSKLELLYNGINRDIFSPGDKAAIRNQLGIGAEEFIVLFVGNLKKEKGIGELVAAYAAFERTAKQRSRLVVIGSGPDQAFVHDLVARKGCSDKVSFLGGQPLEVIANWMNAASVLCLPSYMEGVPNVVLEALSCNTRIIATRVGGVPELDDGSGMITLIEPRRESELLHALLDSVRLPAPDRPLARVATWAENAEHLYSTMFERQ